MPTRPGFQRVTTSLINREGGNERRLSSDTANAAHFPIVANQNSFGLFASDSQCVTAHTPHEDGLPHVAGGFSVIANLYRIIPASWRVEISGLQIGHVRQWAIPNGPSFGGCKLQHGVVPHCNTEALLYRVDGEAVATITTNKNSVAVTNRDLVVAAKISRNAFYFLQQFGTGKIKTDRA